MSGCSSRHIWTISVLRVVLRHTDFGNIPRWWAPDKQTNYCWEPVFRAQLSEVTDWVPGYWSTHLVSNDSTAQFCCESDYIVLMHWVLLIVYCWAVWWVFCLFLLQSRWFCWMTWPLQLRPYTCTCILLKWEVSNILFDIFVHSNCAVNWIVC